MDNTLYTAASGMLARQREVEITANNLANVSVDGYRPEATFHEVFNRVRGRDSRNIESSVNNAVHVPGTYIAGEQGSLTKTGAPLDIAIEGDAWLVVAALGGEAYTRGGSLRLDQDGTLMTLDGDLVLGESGPIVLPQGRVEIDEAGGVFVEQIPVGFLRLARINRGGLEKAGRNLQRLRPGGSEQEIESGATVRQGHIETSAVNPMQELVRLIEAQRAYERHARVVNLMMNDINRKIVNDLAQS